MWRISDDIWDIWHSDVHTRKASAINFKMSSNGRDSRNPAIGQMRTCCHLAILARSRLGQPRQSRLSHDEQRTLMTLWSIFPSPLMIGGELPKADAWIVSLLTNPEVLAVDQHSSEVIR